MIAPRHLLVIASQCDAMRALAHLPDAARSLHEVLSDPELGACIPGLPDGRALVMPDSSHSGGDIYATVRTAIGHADASRATLVLALLGHGFTPGESSSLYFMGPNSREEVRRSAVNVRELLLEAADCAGVAGVIGIIDTCNAAGALLSPADLTTGVRRGRTSLAVLMASAVHQDAHDLRLSRELAALLRTGTTPAGPLIFAENVDGAVRPRLGGQDLAVYTYFGERGGRDALWLAANRRFVSDHAHGTLGRQGSARLAAALAALDPPAPVPVSGRWDDAALRDLSSAITAASWDPARIRLARLLGDLQIALCTTAFLQSWLSQSLTTTMLRAAAASLRPGPGGNLLRIPGSTFGRVQDVVEYLALQYPGSHDGCREWICRFVVALAQRAGRELDAPELIAWARRIDAVMAFNAAVENAARQQADRRLRLIVSLHASVAGDWPPTLDAWLMDGSEAVAHEVFHNRPEPDRAGAEEALAAAVDWAETCAADLDSELRLLRIEVAAPSALLLRWRPEAVTLGRRLGVDYDVIVRWSQRLNPPSGLKWINNHAVKRWERIGPHAATAPVDWLSRHDTHNAERLSEHLLNDRYARAIGLDHVPGGGTQLPGAELLNLLLAFSPVVLWPGAQDGFPPDCQDAFGDYWHTLPTGFIDAYRKAWRDEPTGEPVHVVARLRAIWDDLDWLSFCKSSRQISLTRQGSPQ